MTTIPHMYSFKVSYLSILVVIFITYIIIVLFIMPFTLYSVISLCVFELYI